MCIGNYPRKVKKGSRPIPKPVRESMVSVERRFNELNEDSKNLEIAPSPVPGPRGEKVAPADAFEELFTSHVDFERFQGTYATSMAWVQYMKRKFPDMCIFPHKAVMIELTDPRSTLHKSVYLSPGLQKAFMDCKKTDSKWLVGEVTLLWNYDVGQIMEAGDAHSNALIFDMRRRRMYLFEPLGHLDCEGSSVLYRTFGLMVRALALLDPAPSRDTQWRFFPPPTFCPVVGIQRLEVSQTRYAPKMNKRNNAVAQLDGFCSAWAMLFMHTRMLFPDLLMAEISAKLLADPDEMARRIRGYMSFMVRVHDHKLTTAAKRRQQEKKNSNNNNR